MADTVRLGVIGMGGMGSGHLNYLVNLSGVTVAAVCDIDPARAQAAAAKSGAQAFFDHEALLADGDVDAVLIATPHYAHTPITIHAFEAGKHVLCEKPLAVHVNDAQKTLDAYEAASAKNPNLVFGIMFQERTNPALRKVKDLLDGGELGRLMRATWINTAWFRSQAYYDSGGWRATWGGEGGGILTNQCPHNLDTYQWFFGLPDRITGFASIGKYHHIEVEDEVTAVFQHDNGMVGHFIVTTAESPGVNRLEIVGEHGRVVLEDGKIVFHRCRTSMRDFCRTTPTMFDNVETWRTEIPYPMGGHGHQFVTEKFLAAIRNGQPLDLIAHGTEGIRGVTLANGIMLSSFQGASCTVPLDADAFETRLRELIATSTFQKGGTAGGVVDFTKSWK
jgi:predicted dehydrogenase